jgi:hypothetical protein
MRHAAQGLGVGLAVALAAGVALSCSGSKVDNVGGASSGSGGGNDAAADSATDGGGQQDSGCGLSCAVGFAKDVAPIFSAAKCASRGCHGAGDAQPRLDDSSPAALYASLQTAKISGNPYFVGCTAGAPNTLLCNLQGDPSCGKAMPLNGPPISAENLRTIATWLGCGAPP